MATATCAAASIAAFGSAAVSRSSFLGRSVAKVTLPRGFSVKNESRVVMSRGLWFPGVKPPAYLDGSLPGDRGFDPLGLAKDPILLKRYTEAEVFHGRLAMLVVVGAIIPEYLGLGNWAEYSHLGVDAGSSDAFILGLPPIVVPISGPGLLLFHAVAIAEGSRLYGEVSNGYKGSIDPFTYPGFDPLGVLDGASAEEVADWRTREIKNGRLALVAVLGFVVQSLVTGTGPLANLSDHLASPGSNWIFG
eukprot:TRINITY_DN23529_c0_g1_i1.p1 TRINITY_DN23529_c0_g1~~TRINITY_DN23529_c0_g1_i1.p1  ORF type:complete len:248 (-),score=55.61 TRINITY_DN23529_c0_g1_i1:286-1029(-)